MPRVTAVLGTAPRGRQHPTNPLQCTRLFAGGPVGSALQDVDEQVTEARRRLLRVAAQHAPQLTQRHRVHATYRARQQR